MPRRVDLRRRRRRTAAARRRRAGAAAAPPVGGERARGAPRQAEIAASRASRSRCCPEVDSHRLRRLRGELTGSRGTECGATARWADSPQRIRLDPHWVPRLPRPGSRQLGVAGSIQTALRSASSSSGERQAREDVLEQALAGGEPGLRQLADDLGGGGQELGAAGRLHRAAARARLALEALPAGPADARRMLRRGARASRLGARAGRASALRARWRSPGRLPSRACVGARRARVFAGARVAGRRSVAVACARARGPAAAAALRAAARRGLERCGRVRGRLASTPLGRCGCALAGSSGARVAHRAHHCLSASASSDDRNPVRYRRRRVSMGAWRASASGCNVGRAAAVCPAE